MLKMGMSVKLRAFGSITAAPPHGGGLAISELREQDVKAMKLFIVREAYCQGFAHGTTAHWNPFHARFLFGEPCRLWNYCYDKGALDASQVIKFSLPSLKNTNDPFDLCPTIYVTLTEMAKDFEAAYARCGIDRQSALRGPARALLNWLQTT